MVVDRSFQLVSSLHRLCQLNSPTDQLYHLISPLEIDQLHLVASITDLSSSLLGVSLATLAAVMWAIQYLCVRVGTDDGAVTDAVLVTLCCNVALVVPLVLVVYPGSYAALFTSTSIVAFAAAGFAGSLLARLLMYESVDLIGASRTAPIVSSNVFFATVLAVVFLDETLTIAHFVGIVCIVGGVVVLSWETASSEPDQSLRDVGLSLSLPVAAAAAVGAEPIFVAIGLAEGTPPLPGVMVMAVTATLGFVAYLVMVRVPVRVPLRSPALGWYVGAGISSTIALVTYFAALQVAPVVVVVPLLQTTPLVVAVLSALFLPQRLEQVTVSVVAASVVVVLGAILVSLSG